MALSRRILATHQTYDPADLTAVGWDLTWYADGHLAAQRRCRWAGLRDLDRWVTAAGYLNPYIPPETDDDEPADWLTLELARTAESACEHLDSLRDEGVTGSNVDSWHRTYCGVIVR